jgi:hypothetical protein
MFVIILHCNIICMKNEDLFFMTIGQDPVSPKEDNASKDEGP